RSARTSRRAGRSVHRWPRGPRRSEGSCSAARFFPAAGVRPHGAAHEACAHPECPRQEEQAQLPHRYGSDVLSSTSIPPTAAKVEDLASFGLVSTNLHPYEPDVKRMEYGPWSHVGRWLSAVGRGMSHVGRWLSAAGRGMSQRGGAGCLQWGAACPMWGAGLSTAILFSPRLAS